MKISVNNPCPCHSQKKYKKCCKVFHDGILPQTAELLMRSRYSAFALKKASYIINTTHIRNKDFTEDKNLWENEILIFCKNTNFEGLKILDFSDNKSEAFVTFEAKLSQNRENISFTEKSRFLKEDGKWFYIDGIFLE